MIKATNFVVLSPAGRWNWLLPLFLLLCAACGPAPSPDLESGAAPAVVIVALDGLSWQVADPLVRNGEMPALASLIKDGAAGPLETMRPTWTPVLFTTMATGKEPHEHGISTFVSAEGIPLTSNIRRVPALWNILSSHGKPSLFFGWPVTWPAEDVVGEMISDRWHKTTDRQVHPESSADLISPPLQLFRDNWPAPPASLARLGELAAPDRVSPYLHGSFEGSDSEQADKLVQLTRKKVNTGFLWNVALDSEVKLPLFLQRLRAVQPLLSAVYFNATDMSQHFFGGADRPDQGWIPERNRAGREVVEETYTVYDRLLGELVNQVRSVEGYGNCIFVLLSDHGIDLASGPVVRLRPREDTPQYQWVSFVEQALATAGLPVSGIPLLTGPPPPRRPEAWLTLSFSGDKPMALRSRALNRLDLAGCRFHPDDVYLYFVHDEAPPGVVVISGGDVEAGQTIDGMSVADVAPTVLALLGLPSARDMAGRPAGLRLAALGAVRPRVLQTALIPTYGSTRPAGQEGEAISSPVDETIRDELRALGYIE